MGRCFRQLPIKITVACHLGGQVYLLNPSAGLLLHMYDDRGLDVIATSTVPLLPLQKQFCEWINDARMDENEASKSWQR